MSHADAETGTRPRDDQSPASTVAIARAQSSLRILNARIELQFSEAIHEPLDDHDHLLIRCECGKDDCDAVISVHHGEWRAARLDDRRFIVAPNHGVDGVDRLSARTERFDLVETYGDAASVA